MNKGALAVGIDAMSPELTAALPRPGSPAYSALDALRA